MFSLIYLFLSEEKQLETSWEDNLRIEPNARNAQYRPQRQKVLR